MVRICGVNLPRNKRIDVGLTSVFGIGHASARQIINEANIANNTRCSELTDSEITRIRKTIDNGFITEGELRRRDSLNIKRLTEIGSAAGRRHRVGLPVRGQRTRTNAQTRKRRSR
jgi:small subunit ribosomal protein S13